MWRHVINKASTPEFEDEQNVNKKFPDCIPCGEAVIRCPFLSDVHHDDVFACSMSKDKNCGFPPFEMRFQYVSYKSTKIIRSSSEFEPLRLLGKGAFGDVVLVRQRHTKNIYAAKVVRKQSIRSDSEALSLITERNIHSRLRSPFVVRLHMSFQSPQNLYILLQYMPGGELYEQIKREPGFSEERVRFHAAEIALGLAFLHDCGVIYRDLKPENILLDSRGHAALADFGLSKECAADESTRTFCGTIDYVAPEVVAGKSYSHAADWWSYGIVLYEMLVGVPPFYDRGNPKAVYDMILYREPNYKLCVVSTLAQGLLESLLTKNPCERIGWLGNSPDKSVKHSAFFLGVDWRMMELQQVDPPFKLSVPLKKEDPESPCEQRQALTSFSDSIDSQPEGDWLQRMFRKFSFTSNANCYNETTLQSN